MEKIIIPKDLFGRGHSEDAVSAIPSLDRVSELPWSCASPDKDYQLKSNLDFGKYVFGLNEDTLELNLIDYELSRN